MVWVYCSFNVNKFLVTVQEVYREIHLIVLFYEFLLTSQNFHYLLWSKFFLKMFLSSCNYNNSLISGREKLEISRIEWHQMFYFVHMKFAVLKESSYQQCTNCFWQVLSRSFILLLIFFY